MHKGKRTDLVRIACLCETDTMRAEDVEDEMLSRAPKSQKTQQKTRVGNMDALDPTGQGIKGPSPTSREPFSFSELLVSPAA